MLTWEDQVYLVLGLFQLGVALLLLLVPPRFLVRRSLRQGHFQRPWFGIWPNLTAGLANVLLITVKLWNLPSSVRAFILLVAYVSLALFFGMLAWFISRLWRNSRRAEQPTVSFVNDAYVPTTHLGQLYPNLEHDVWNMLLNGNKLLAIKRVREQTGIGLAEAKEYVDGLEART